MKRALILALVLVMVLGSLGVAYGMWFKTLTITGTVRTGTVDWQFFDVKTTDQETKDVGTCVASVDPATGNVSFTIDNAYPSYQCWVEFAVKSLGSIPIHVHQPVPFPTNPTWVALDGCYLQDIQLHQNDVSPSCKLKMHFTNADNVDQNATYTFNFKVGAHQYNEEPTAPWPPVP